MNIIKKGDSKRMALLPTGSDKLLEISTEKLNVVIKSRRSWQGDIYNRSSSLVLDGMSIKEVKIAATEEDIECENFDYAHHEFEITPIFFEQTDYEIIIKSNDGSQLSFWNENSSIKDRVGSAYDGDYTLLSGVLNFENTCGYSDFEISADGVRYDTAVNVGKRHGKPVIYEVLSRKMAQDGHEFFLSANGVWLTKAVPVEYLKKITD